MSPCNLVGLANTSISTGCAQKSPRSLLQPVHVYVTAGCLPDPSVRKSHRVHVDILRFSLIKLRWYIL